MHVCMGVSAQLQLGRLVYFHMSIPEWYASSTVFYSIQRLSLRTWFPIQGQYFLSLWPRAAHCPRALARPLQEAARFTGRTECVHAGADAELVLARDTGAARCAHSLLQGQRRARAINTSSQAHLLSRSAQ